MTKPFHSIRDLVGRVSELLGLRSEAETVTPDVSFYAETTDPTLEMDAAEPMAETEAVEPFAEPARPEVADIEELYRSSFSTNSFPESNFDETVEITDLDTMDDALGDSGMDDEMIEASYAGGPHEDNVVDFVSAAALNEEIKGFDWSPESMVTERVSQDAEASGFEPKFVFEETQEPENVVTFEQEVAHSFEPETVSPFAHEDAPSFEPAEAGPFEHEAVLSFEQEPMTPEYACEDTPEHEVDVTEEIETFQPTVAEAAPATENNGASAEPSAELI